MTKVKFLSQTVKEKLQEILDKFPKLDNIHPFYQELLNILYDKDHYKIALSQISVVINTVEQISNEYVRFLKYSDSLYKAKTLKTTAFGKSITALKKLNKPLLYLNDVRKHASRLPSIDPYNPTVLVIGAPSVGKSSFIKEITNAKLEVNSLPFTT